jgi:hypothetical protein
MQARMCLAILGGWLCAIYTHASIAGDTSDNARQSLDRMARAAQTNANAWWP